MTKYRKKPVVIEAIQFTGENEFQVKLFTKHQFDVIDEADRAEDPDIVAQVWDRLHSTWVGVNLGDYIIKGVQGEFYPCREDVFEETYEYVG